jgi:hypothetical protein
VLPRGARHPQKGRGVLPWGDRPAVTKTLALVEREKAHHAASRLCRVLGCRARAPTPGRPPSRAHAPSPTPRSRARSARSTRPAAAPRPTWSTATSPPSGRTCCGWASSPSCPPTGACRAGRRCWTAARGAWVGWWVRSDWTAELATGALGIAVSRRGPLLGWCSTIATTAARTPRWRSPPGWLGAWRAWARSATRWTTPPARASSAGAAGRRAGVRDPVGGQDGGVAWLGCWYNPRRRHPTLQDLAPLEHEQVFYSGVQSHRKVASTKP